MSEFATADLWDAHPFELQAVEPGLLDFGGERTFCGPISTLKVYEDNTLVREALETAGDGRVLVVDGGGSLHCALVGDKLGVLAQENRWAGIVVNGCVRDAAQLASMPVGIRALGSMPVRSVKGGQGLREVTVRFLGASFEPGHWLYADEDGIVLASRDLLR